MRLLLDTHTLFWSVDDPARVSAAAMAVIQPLANDVLLSAATVWELAIEVGLRKMSLSLPYRQWMEKAITDLKLVMLPITVEYAERQSTLPLHHKDPFDLPQVVMTRCGTPTNEKKSTGCERALSQTAYFQKSPTRQRGMRRPLLARRACGRERKCARGRVGDRGPG